MHIAIYRNMTTISYCRPDVIKRPFPEQTTNILQIAVTKWATSVNMHTHLLMSYFIGISTSNNFPANNLILRMRVKPNMIQKLSSLIWFNCRNG